VREAVRKWLRDQPKAWNSERNIEYFIILNKTGGDIVQIQFLR
jgi:hypothetical protein